MKPVPLTSSLALLAVAALLAAGCGTDEATTQSTPEPAATTPEAESLHGNGATGPQSAGEDVPNAPDDAIEDRPGGHGEDGGGPGRGRRASPTRGGSSAPSGATSPPSTATTARRSARCSRRVRCGGSSCR